jgi:glc operon protein GlcG
VLLSPPGAGAQTPLASPGSLPPYGPGIGLEVAEAAAEKNGWQEPIAVVDSGGRLVAFFRMDNTQLASIDIAIGKAVTANNVKRSTKALQDSVAPGSSTPRMQGLSGITPVDGGLRQSGRRGRRRGPCRRHREVAAA